MIDIILNARSANKVTVMDDIMDRIAGPPRIIMIEPTTQPALIAPIALIVYLTKVLSNQTIDNIAEEVYAMAVETAAANVPY